MSRLSGAARAGLCGYWLHTIIGIVLYIPRYHTRHIIAGNIYGARVFSSMRSYPLFALLAHRSVLTKL